MRVTFEQVKLPAVKKAPCRYCGKMLTRRTTFMETINPWNKNAAGLPKDREEIIASLQRKVATWIKDTIVECRNCG